MIDSEIRYGNSCLTAGVYRRINNDTEPLSWDIWLDDSSVPIVFVAVLAAEGVDLTIFGPLQKISVEVGNVG